MAKFELVIRDKPGMLFGTLEEAKLVGLAMLRGGATVHIEVFPDSVPGLMTGFRYDAEVNDWVATDLPIRY